MPRFCGAFLFMNEIKQVPWSSYRSVLLPLVEKTEKRNNDSFSEQIDNALSNERAFLFVGSDGFIVLEPLQRNGISQLNIMFALNNGGDAIVRYQSTVEKLAHDIGATEITLRTKVKQIRPLIEQQGFELVHERDGVMHFKLEI